MGTILRVNLTTGEITTQSAEPYRDWIGGIGVGEKIDDLQPFNADEFARALFSKEEE